MTDDLVAVHITELDVSFGGSPGTKEELLAKQAEIYRGILRVCLQAANCKVR